MGRFQRFAARCCLAAMLFGQVAQAHTYDIMVVVPNPPNVNIDYGHNQVYQIAMRTTLATIKILDIAHANYGTIAANKCRVEWMRTGVFGRGVVTSGIAESVDSARCVVIPAFAGSLTLTCNGNRADSLMRSARGGSLVPTLFVMDNAIAATATSGAAWGDDASPACSTGVVGVANATVGVSAWPYLKSNPTVRWPFLTFANPLERNPSADPAGGIRVVVGGAATNFINTSISQGGLNDQWPEFIPTLDSPGVSLGKDSMYVWDRPWSHITGAKTQTFVKMAGCGMDTRDSLFNTNVYPDLSNAGGLAEFDVGLLVAGLCHFDSLTLAQTGRRLIFGAMPAPKKIALTIDGGLTRTLRYYGYRAGIDPGDTTGFYTTLDSLRLAGIPATIGVNVDSAASYARDIIKLRGYTQARFTPQVWTGASVNDSSNYAKSARFHDIFGRWNNRAFAGDSVNHSVATADTSILAQLAKARAVTDSLFPGRASRFVLAPDDDYSPKQMRPKQTGTSSGSYADSILDAIYYAGFVGMRVDGKYTDADPRRTGSMTNPRGWFTQSRRVHTASGNDVKLLAHAGYELNTTSWAISFQDSTAPFDSSAVGPIEQARWTCGMWDMAGQYDSDALLNYNSTAQDFNTWRNVKYVFEDHQDPRIPTSAQAYYANCRVIRMACSELSGRSPDPARVGWIQVKGLNDWMKACNVLAGTTIMTWAYPEDIDP